MQDLRIRPGRKTGGEFMPGKCFVRIPRYVPARRKMKEAGSVQINHLPCFHTV